jgi:hypothetical protein
LVTLPTTPIAEFWASLNWSSGALVATNSRVKPLAIASAPRLPGIYRMTWLGAEDWVRLAKVIEVKASVKVMDARLDFSSRMPPVLMTVGRTTNIYERLRQHFSTNPHNNRVLSRLRKLLPELELMAILDLARNNLLVEWVAVPSWIERCLLENYGLVNDLPVLDLDAEH